MKKQTRLCKKSPHTLLFAALCACSFPSYATELIIKIQGLKNADGQLVAFLFANANKEKFPTDISAADCTTKAPASTQAIELTCSNVTPGTYAVFAFHDRNNNGTLDHSFIGMPKEPLGFSSGCKATFGPPKFDKCKFDVGESTTEVVVSIK